VFTGDLRLINGGDGYVAWGYRTAARCRSWTVHRSPDGYWTLRADVTSADPFQLRQTPLEFRTPRKGGFLCWPVVTVSLVDRHLSATLGAPVS
jgi:hypothetical protein